MKKYISILRWINVWWKRKILMKDLKELYYSLGFKNVITYIQSWNVIFESDKQVKDILENIEETITKNYDFLVPVIIKTFEEIDEAIKINPFIKNSIEKLHLTFLSDIPDNKLIKKIEEFNFQEDKFEIIWKNVFILCKGKYYESKFTNNFFEKKLKVRASTRNWKTVTKLYELSM